MPRHRVLTPLRWSDMDAYGHVNNVQFLRLIEDARVVAFAAAGSDEGGSVVNTGLIVASARIEYLEQLVYRTAPVAIDLWVTAIAGASFDLGYEVLDEVVDEVADGDVHDVPDGDVEAGRRARPHVYARAETTLVTYDLAGHRPRRITAEERATLELWRDDPVLWRHRPAPR